ncbi:MAG: glycosyltransferase family 9 protein [Phycisphaeraceae bacterium]|nr:MAG: glycosyltransferase family 9 protein [Phycisphaeraceae bacterium]
MNAHTEPASSGDSRSQSSAFIFHRGALGDSVLLWPLLRSLVAAHGRVAFVTDASKARLAARFNPGVEPVDAEQPRFNAMFAPSPNPARDFRPVHASRVLCFLFGEPSESSRAWEHNATAMFPGAVIDMVYERPDAILARRMAPDHLFHAALTNNDAATRSAPSSDTTDPRSTLAASDAANQRATNTASDAAEQRAMVARPKAHPGGVAAGSGKSAAQRLPWWSGADAPDSSSSASSRTTFGDRYGPTIIHVGAGSPMKRWPLEIWREIDRQLVTTHELLFIAGEAEADVIASCKWSPQTSQCGWALINSLDELASELVHARAFVGFDTGPTHLAAQLGLPTLALFGPTDPNRWSPIGPLVLVLAPAKPTPDMSWLSPDVVARAIAQV